MTPNKFQIILQAMSKDNVKKLQQTMWSKLWDAPENFTSDDWQLLTAIKNELKNN